MPKNGNKNPYHARHVESQVLLSMENIYDLFFEDFRCLWKSCLVLTCYWKGCRSYAITPDDITNYNSRKEKENGNKNCKIKDRYKEV